MSIIRAAANSLTSARMRKNVKNVVLNNKIAAKKMTEGIRMQWALQIGPEVHVRISFKSLLSGTPGY